MSYAITSKGQVTIPKKVRDHLGVEPGASIAFRLNDKGEVVIEAVDKPRPLPRGDIDSVVGIFGPGPSTDEIMKMLRGDDDT